jgi:superoxide reductase
MTQLDETYKCEICGNIVKVINPGRGELVCCGQPMVILEEENYL